MVWKSPRIGLSLAKEAACALLSYELFPLCLIYDSLPVLPSFAPPKKERIHPVLLVHGIFHNPSAFLLLKQRLVWAGFRRFGESRFSPSLRSIHSNAEILAGQVESLKKKFGVMRIDIVAHSMGGIISRYFIQRLGGGAHVRSLITLGTPHGGLEWSKLSFFPHLRELHPQSRTMNHLLDTPPPKNLRAVAIAGEFDFVIRPKKSALWKGAKNFSLKGLGHTGLLFSQRVCGIIIKALAN